MPHGNYPVHNVTRRTTTEALGPTDSGGMLHTGKSKYALCCTFEMINQSLHRLKPLLALGICLLVGGCGGSGTISLPAGYAGTWAETPSTANNVTMTIKLTGVVQAESPNAYAISGLVNDSGQFNGQINFLQISGFIVPVSGTILPVGNTGQLRFQYTGQTSGGTVTGDLNYTKI